MTAEVETATSDHAPGAVRAALHESTSSLASVLRHPSLRKVQIALAVSLTGDWAYNTASAVWAYGIGGATTVGVWGAIRLLIRAVSASTMAVFADRHQKRVVLVVANLACCALIAAAGACIGLGTPAAAVFVLATLAPIAASVVRPALAAWTPSLVDRPEQLTSSNATASTTESLTFFIGPAIGAGLIALTNVQTVFILNALSFAIAAALFAVVTEDVEESPAPTSQSGSERETGDEPSALSEVFAGFSLIARDRGLLTVAILSCTQTIVAGASAVFGVLLAVHTLHTGPKGIGIIDSVFGVGAIVGGFIALSRANRDTLATDLGVGTFLWSAPLLLIVLHASPLTVFAAVALMGLGNPLVDVNFATIIQRLVPSGVVARVFGAFEGSLIATMALGAACMPGLVHLVSLRGALAVIALLVAVPTVLLGPAIHRINRRLAPPEGLDLLAAISIFAPLAPAALDAVARQLVPIAVAAGETIVREGTESDLFYVIRTGRVAVSHGDEFVRHEGPGDFFGEIGLLRSVPRTATVTAVETTELYTLDRSAFLEAVASETGSSTALEDVVSFRMRF